MKNIVCWQTKNKEYAVHTIWPIGTTFIKEPGICVYVFESSPGSWRPVYIEHTHDMSEPFDNHPKKDIILEHGATHVTVQVAHFISENRQEVVDDLVSVYEPECNEELDAPGPVV